MDDVTYSQRANVDSASHLYSLVALGDEAAFAQFYDVVIRSVYGIVRSVVRDAAQSEEVTHDVLLELWRVAPRWDGSQGSAERFCCTVARRRAVDRVRSEEARRARDTRFVSQGSRVMTDDPSEIAVEVEARTAMAEALAQLPATLRQPIELAFCDGHTHREIASILDLPLGTVKGRIRNGLARLHRQLVSSA